MRDSAPAQTMKAGGGGRNSGSSSSGDAPEVSAAAIEVSGRTSACWRCPLAGRKGDGDGDGECSLYTVLFLVTFAHEEGLRCRWPCPLFALFVGGGLLFVVEFWFSIAFSRASSVYPCCLPSTSPHPRHPRHARHPPPPALRPRVAYCCVCDTPE